MTHPVFRWSGWATALILLLLLAGCASRGDVRAPLRQQLLTGTDAAGKHALVIVLPGRGDDLDALRRSGIATAIQTGWPEADVLLAEVRLTHYMQGNLPERLHEELVLPARAQGYRQIWLAGASMGGMGTLLYDRRYPGDMSGLVLFAPFLGERRVIEEIDAAGGIAQWQPGPVPGTIDGGNYQREIWRHIQAWSRPGNARATTVWLAYGENDRLRKAMPPLIAQLPESHVLARPGGHAWAVWSPAAAEVFAIIRASVSTTHGQAAHSR